MWTRSLLHLAVSAVLLAAAPVAGGATGAAAETGHGDVPAMDGMAGMEGMEGMEGMDAGDASVEPAQHGGHEAEAARPTDSRTVVLGGFAGANVLILAGALVLRRRTSSRRGRPQRSAA